jgi:hypothetical protein
MNKKRKSTKTARDDKATKDHEGGGPSQSSQREAPPMPDPSPVEVPSTKATSLRGRKLVFPSPSAADKVKARRPLTRETTKQEIPVKDDAVGVSAQRKGKSIAVENPVEIIDITTPQKESNHTFKRLKRQLKEARVEVDEMKKGELVAKKKLNGLMDMYHETIDKARFIAKRFRPLHRQLKNLYRQNKAYQAQIRKLKMELQPFKEELAKRNMDMLAKFATRRSSRVRK